MLAQTAAAAALNPRAEAVINVPNVNPPTQPKSRKEQPRYEARTYQAPHQRGKLQQRGTYAIQQPERSGSKRVGV